MFSDAAISRDVCGSGELCTDWGLNNIAASKSGSVLSIWSAKDGALVWYWWFWWYSSFCISLRTLGNWTLNVAKGNGGAGGIAAELLLSDWVTSIGLAVVNIKDCEVGSVDVLRTKPVGNWQLGVTGVKGSWAALAGNSPFLIKISKTSSRSSFFTLLLEALS